jgi:hypothetical protein
MKFLVIGSWDPGNADIPRLLEEEQHRTGELMRQGVIRELLLRADGAGGYMVVFADSIAVAHEQLRTLPFMRHGIMHVELIELRD